MDIAYFINDLLGQQGNVSVPNLGHFAQVRIPAFYDNRLKQYLPPHYSVQFEPAAANDDETLAAHISAVKKISQSSAKYFIEKFINNLKSQAIVEKIDFANMGTFSSDGSKLIFNPAKNNDDPTFFAFAPIDVHRIGDNIKRQATVNEKPVTPVTEPQTVNTISSPGITAPIGQVIIPRSEEEMDEVYADEPRGIATWMIVISAVTVLLIALLLLYKFKPELFQQFYPVNDTPSESKVLPVVKKDTSTTSLVPVKQDSITKNDTTVTLINTTAAPQQENKIPQEAVKTDKTSAKTNEQPSITPVTTTPATGTPAVDIPDAVTRGTWVIYSQVFPTRHGADRRIEELKAKGFAQARLASTKVNRGGNYKVILGAFKTRAEAKDTEKELLATGKLKKDDLFVEQY